MLSDGNLLFAYNHHHKNSIYFLRREKDYGGVIILSTEKFSENNWIKINSDKLLVILDGEKLVLSYRIY